MTRTAYTLTTIPYVGLCICFQGYLEGAKDNQIVAVKARDNAERASADFNALHIVIGNDAPDESQAELAELNDNALTVSSTTSGPVFTTEDIHTNIHLSGTLASWSKLLHDFGKSPSVLERIMWNHEEPRSLMVP